MTKHKIQNNIKAQIQNGKTFVPKTDIGKRKTSFRRLEKGDV